jgi:hypothetical protein
MSQQFPPPPPAPQFGAPQEPQFGNSADPHVAVPEGFGGAPAPRPLGSGMAVTSFVLGVLAILLCLFPVVDILAILLAIVGGVLGVVALSKVNRGTGAGRGLGIAGLVLSVLAFVGGVGSAIFYAAFVSEVGQTIEESAQDLEDSAADKGVAAEPEEVEAAADALPLGQSATVGDYQVAITAVNTNANDVIGEFNKFNEAPANQYVLVDLAVTYQGGEEGDPAFDLGLTLQGADARQYDDTACMAVLPKDGMDVPTLTNGGQAEFQFCLDAPPAALDGATLFVEDTMSIRDTRVYWNLQ